MTFPSAHATIYRNEVGEVLGWDEPSYDDPYDYDDEEKWLDSPDALVCGTHGGWAKDCEIPFGHECETVHVDELCCGPDGCCSHCCGTEDEYKGDWHKNCDIGKEAS